MNFLHLLFRWLLLAGIVAAFLVGLAFVPDVQTWIAQLALREAGFPGSLGSCSVGFGSVELTGLHLKMGGADLALPELEADLPIFRVLWRRQVSVRRVEAKGWTLDLRGQAQEGAAPLAFFHGALQRWHLPFDLSLDGVALEGVVLVPEPGSRDPARVHLAIQGGGLRPGRDGIFLLEASSSVLDRHYAVTELTGHGRLAVGLRTPRTFQEVGIRTDFSAQGGSFPAGLHLAADFSDRRDGDGEICQWDLRQGARHLASVRALLPSAGDRLAGTWKLDVRDSDLSPFLPDQALPRFRAIGEGRFDTPADLARVRVAGRIRVEAGPLGALWPALETAGPLSVDADFDGAGGSDGMQVDRMEATVAAVRPIATVHLFERFTCGFKAGRLEPSAPSGDWLGITLRRFPLERIPALPSGVTLAAGEASGEIRLRAEKDGWALRSPAPLTATGVTLRRGDRTLARDLGLSADLSANAGSTGWRVRLAPLRVTRHGAPVADFTAQASAPGGPNRPAEIAGDWKADLSAFGFRSASGSFSSQGEAALKWKGKAVLDGPGPRDSIAVEFDADVGEDGTISYFAPLKVASASGASDFSLQGKWLREEDGVQFSATVSGQDVALEHLQRLAAPWVGTEGRDQAPFWGDSEGSIRLELEHLQTPDRRLSDVGGTFEFTRGAVRLEGGHAGLDAPRAARVEATVAFDPAAPSPYRLSGTVALDPFKVAEAAVEGRVAVSASLSGRGLNLADLAAHTEEEFRLSSTDAIVRLLKTDVHDAIPPDNSSALSEGLSTVGSAVGSIFSVKQRSNAEKSRLSDATEAVINFTYDAAELGFDQATLVATREAGGAIRLSAITLVNDRERLTGSGRIEPAEGRPLTERPLRLDLEFWARGPVAKLLATAGLLSSAQDPAGYVRLIQPIHLGGTLDRIDARSWHELLLAAAAKNPLRQGKR